MIHIIIKPNVKKESELIFKRLVVNTSYTVSMFLNQVVLRGGFLFEIEFPKNNNDDEYTNLAKIIESTAENGTVSKKNKNIFNLHTSGQIDYETTMVNLGIIKLLKSDNDFIKVRVICYIFRL